MEKITKNGKSFFVSDHHAATLIFWQNIENWEKQTFKIFDKFMDADHSFLNIGAWIGAGSLYSAQIAKYCYAIEPDPLAFELLEINVNLNEELRKKIKCSKIAFWNGKSQINMGCNDALMGNSMSSMFKHPEQPTRSSWITNTISLEEYVSENNITDCNFVKMDIEGAEAVVIPNSINFFQTQKPTLHLSIHPYYFSEPMKDSKNIIDVLSVYKNVYNEQGNRINLNDTFFEFLLKNEEHKKWLSYPIVCTDKEW